MRLSIRPFQEFVATGLALLVAASGFRCCDCRGGCCARRVCYERARAIEAAKGKEKPWATIANSGPTWSA